jgi:hypothetical protein
MLTVKSITADMAIMFFYLQFLLEFQASSSKYEDDLAEKNIRQQSINLIGESKNMRQLLAPKFAYLAIDTICCNIYRDISI